MASDNGTEIRVLAATDVRGSGFREASLAEAMRRQPHFIGCDCGSTDPGPYPLGAGTTAFPRVALKRDLRLMLLAARQAGIPLLLASAGTAGGVPHVAIVKDILSEIAAEEGLSFPLALIQDEQDKTHEFCLLFEVTAPTQEIASSIAAITRHQAIHLPIPEWGDLITGVACPYNPAYLERGAVYRFCVNHVVEPDDPYEMFPIEYVDVHCKTDTKQEMVMATLGELARLIHSKNADPFELTFDIMFAKPEVYERVRDSGALSREVVAAHYGLPPDEVKFFVCDNALAFKASIPRPNFQGDLFDSDNHGGQQYAPLMDIEIPGL
jgi:Domain of unknown function (DUF4387)